MLLPEPLSATLAAIAAIGTMLPAIRRSKRSLLLAAVVFFAAEGSSPAQHLIIKPGDVIAGKTLTGASDIAVSDHGRLVFRGAFEEGGKQQAALFDYDLSTRAATLIASTETPFDGFALTDLRQPFLSGKGKLVWRGETEAGAVIFGDGGPLVKTGDPLSPGKFASAPFDPLVNNSGVSLVFDGSAAYQLPSKQVATFPVSVDGKEVGGPIARGASFNDFGAVTYVDDKLGAIVGYVPASGGSAIFLRPGNSVNLDWEFIKGYGVSESEKNAFVVIGDLRSGGFAPETLRSVFLNGMVLATENDIVDGVKLGAMSDIELTTSNLIYVASEGRIIQLPEPSSIGLAIVGATALALPVLHRSRRRSCFHQ